MGCCPSQSTLAALCMTVTSLVIKIGFISARNTDVCVRERKRERHEVGSKMGKEKK